MMLLMLLIVLYNDAVGINFCACLCFALYNDNNNECTKSANPRCLHGHCTELCSQHACMPQQLCFWLYS